GEISVNSEWQKGTRFDVVLPLVLQPSKSPVVPPLEKTAEAPLILLVEDHPDLGQYIATGLKDQYRIEMAYNGREGLEKALNGIPDLIISDVMMPEMNGYELCERLKQDKRSSHIPIILLTAKNKQEARLTGLDKGADAYLTKPFDEQELQLRIRNLLDKQRKLHQYFRQKNGWGTETAPNTTDQQSLSTKEEGFLAKLHKCIDQHLDDPDLNINFLSREMGLSYKQLHRKLLALTGLTPVKIIREVRLKKAKQLLKDPSYNVSDVAYAIGFSDPAYFSRAFKQAFGIAPSNYRNQHLAN
ncbi:MAG: response regulator, partial [Bacteroidota bacterium]